MITSTKSGVQTHIRYKHEKKWFLLDILSASIKLGQIGFVFSYTQIGDHIFKLKI